MQAEKYGTVYKPDSLLDYFTTMGRTDYQGMDREFEERGGARLMLKALARMKHGRGGGPGVEVPNTRY